MRTAVISLLLLLATILTAQTTFSAVGFEAQALRYQPLQRPGVTDKSFNFGKMVLEETVRQTKNNTADFSRTDYVNVLTAFLALQEPAAAIRLAFDKFRASEGSCEYFTSQTFKEQYVDKRRGEAVADWWVAAEAVCWEDGYQPEAPSSPESYAAAGGPNAGLQALVATISQDDQRFRKDDYQPELQTPLDRDNERLIDSLYGDYEGYLGTSLVGKDLSHVMWIVIQHSRLPVMERYLPVVHAAVLAGELAEVPLRMLLDRIYTAKTGRQVFGSQTGVERIPAAEREKICLQYGIE